MLKRRNTARPAPTLRFSLTRVAVVLEHPLAGLDLVEALQAQRVQRLVPNHPLVQVDGGVMLFK